MICDIVDNKIRMHGNPTNIDKGELLVRIISNLEVILMEFTIIVEPIDNELD